jgi:UV excision repair protein RAD23
MVMGTERQAALDNLVSMGFDRSEAERAMRAAFYNPDRAVEYLISGIPTSAQQAAPQQPQGGQGGGAQQPADAGDTSDIADTDMETDEPVNLFEAAAAQGGGSGRGASRGAGAGAGAGTGAATLSSALGGAGGADAGNLDFLRENPTFRNLRQLVQQQPAMLEQVLQQVAGSNPQLAQMISSNPEAFMQLLAEGGDEEGVPLPPGAQSVSVTEEERDAIERLCRLGFDRDMVIQAYFACDKNEELAANFLFDQPGDDE